MSNIEDVQHIINFLRDNEIETGHTRGIEPLEEMLKENKLLMQIKGIVADCYQRDTYTAIALWKIKELLEKEGLYNNE